MDSRSGWNSVRLIAVGLALVAFSQISVAQTWVQSHPGGAGAPSARAWHAFSANAGTDAYLYSGLTNGGQPRDFWRYSFTSNSWTEIPLPSKGGPGARHAASSSFASGKFVLFGGSGPSQRRGKPSTILNDAWLWDETSNEWTSSPTKCVRNSPCPGQRWFGSFTFDQTNGYHLLFGGQQPLSNVIYGDTWSYTVSGNTGAWTLHNPISHPSARFQSALAHVASQGGVVLYGGRDATSILTDLWTWRGSNWQVITQHNAGPVVRDAAATYDEVLGFLVVVGGSVSLNEDVPSADTWVFNFSNGLWTNLGETAGLTPRVGTRLVYSTGAGKTAFSHGSAGTGALLLDTWESN